MTSTPIISLIIIILGVILVDVFCGDITNTRQASPWQNNQNSRQKSPDILPDGKSTTPWPTLGQRRNPNWSRNTPASTRATTPSPKKWIQQNNIWIKNEQVASGGNVAPQNVNTNRQGGRGSVRANGQPSTGGQNGSQQNRGGNTANLGVSNVNVPKGNTQMNVRPQTHQTNQQQALINGLINNEKLGPPGVTSSTPKSNFNPATPTNKPMSYAGAVGPKSPTPTSPGAPKTPPVSLPLSPQPGGPKRDAVPSTGPTTNNENVDKKDSNNSGDVSDEELREFSEMLLRKDTNNAMKYVTLNLQGMTSSRTPNDAAPLPLMKIDKEAYKIPSIEQMMLLYNNYFLDSSQNEVYTGQERIEENNLLDTVLATPVMQFARSFLINKGKIGKDPKEFRDLLRLIWFNMYSRGQGRIGSSGFEHIFLAEIKNNQVSGLHNWVYFNEEESQNRANYLGYLKKLDLGDKGAILKYHFTFHDIDKPVGSMFIGTSPELEMALYSTCFVLRADKICPLKMNGNKFIIRTYTYRYRGKNMIGSAFPEI